MAKQRKKNGADDVYVAAYVPKATHIQLFELQAKLQKQSGKRVTISEMLRYCISKQCAIELKK